MISLRDILNLISKVSRILSLYDEKTNIDDILDNIYIVVKADKKKKDGAIPIDELLDKFPNMDKPLIINSLLKCKKNDIIEIAKRLGMKVSSHEKLDILAENVANFYSIKQLSIDMSSRNDSINAFIKKDNESFLDIQKGE